MHKILQIKCPLSPCVSLGMLILICFVFIGERSYAFPSFPIMIGSNNKHLVDQNKIPVLINGEAAWSVMVRLTKSETEKYLENRRLKGFNAILVNLVEHHFGGPKNRDGQEPFTVPGDFSCPNDLYFTHVDWVIRKAAEKGILVFLFPAYLGYRCGNEGWCKEMIANGPTKMLNYGRYVGNRYNRYRNIVWVEGGDAFGGNAIRELRAVTQGIKETDKMHIHAAHCSRQSSALDCYDEDWLNINTTYSDCSSSAIKTLADYSRARRMPFLFIEGKYENEGASAQCLRSQAYWSILGGSTGHFFGNDPIWKFTDDWQGAMESTGSKSMAHIGALLNTRPWSDLVPDYRHTIVTAGYGRINSSSYLAAAQTRDGNTVIAYMPTGRRITVDMTKISGSSVKGWWYNPSTGMATSIGLLPNTGSMDFLPPSNADWVLVLDNSKLNLIQPGGK